MKKLEIILKPEKLEELKDALSDMVGGMTITSVMGFGAQRGAKEYYRGVEVTVRFLPKYKVEIVVDNTKVEGIVAKARAVLNTGHTGDGKIFVYEVTDAVRVRTGESGESAI
ncbi:MAG: P-II family nitrogen regulator [Eubacteriales bacterium]|nr:P-II family nitrogen regulator [Eubacteriales bacterium]MDD3880650.1 P-II family nitrogen regulator [Eubacteriales bacterium]MDD4513555.1 P-II family nitrogen regulator [Eubacteriales bacterium]